YAQAAVAPYRVTTRLQGPHPLEHRARRPRRPEREHFVQPLEVGHRRHFPACEQRFDLRREQQVAVLLAIEQWAYAEPIAREQHGFGASVVDREGELTVEP